MELNAFINTGTAEGWLRQTDNVNEIRVNGQSQNQRVYEVRIDRLHYNVQNGRIATFISRYQMEHGKLPEDVEARDELIEKMIEEDNPARLKTTRLDIKTKGQQDVAIILSNGIVIDGNRRFTCLRMLSREESQPRFLRCYIFPDTFDEKAIKGLELEIQLGRDEKVDYDPISRLVDINTWVNGGRMTSEEYRTYANISKGDMGKFLRQIDVLNDFLDFIDRTRKVRELCDYVAESEQGDGSYVDEQLEIVEQVLEKLEDMPENTAVSTEFIRDNIGADANLKNEQKASNEKARMRAGNRAIKNGQVRNTHDALGSLSGIDDDLLGKLASEQLDDMNETLQKIIDRATSLKATVEALQEA